MKGEIEKKWTFIEKTTRNDKGKPAERQGRKATGLRTKVK
jgi:hypothetical protein